MAPTVVSEKAGRIIQAPFPGWDKRISIWKGDAVNRVWIGLLMVSLALSSAGQAPPSPTPTGLAMVAAVSRNDAFLFGGISTGNMTATGTVSVEVLAYLSPSGEWVNHSCAQSYSKGCDQFAHDYLAKAHDSVVVSADGRGTTVHAAPVTLDECYDYSGIGTYDGDSMSGTAIAASSPAIFSTGDLRKARSWRRSSSDQKRSEVSCPLKTRFTGCTQDIRGSA